MKAISLTQPWASLVARGMKRCETRSWTTSYRGPIAIHAAKGFPKAARDFASVELALGRVTSPLPFGGIVAVCRLVEVVPTEQARVFVTGLERHLGDFSPGRFAWFLEDIEELGQPVPCRGALSLWTVPAEVEAMVMREETICRHPSDAGGLS